MLAPSSPSPATLLPGLLLLKAVQGHDGMRSQSSCPEAPVVCAAESFPPSPLRTEELHQPFGTSSRTITGSSHCRHMDPLALCATANTKGRTTSCPGGVVHSEKRGNPNTASEKGPAFCGSAPVPGPGGAEEKAVCASSKPQGTENRVPGQPKSLASCFPSLPFSW